MSSLKQSVHAAVVALLVTTVGLSASNCGRVSFFQDGQRGDGGVNRPRSSSSSSSMGTQSSSAMEVEDGGCVARDPAPTYQVLPEDIDGTFVSAWDAKGCKTCHAAGANFGTVMMPPMPDDINADKAAAAANLNTYCRTADMTGQESLVDDTGLAKVRMLCKVLPVGANPPLLCGTHTGGKSGALGDVRDLGTACVTAATRYKAALDIWLDAGVPDGSACNGGDVDAGPVDAGPAFPCPRPDLQPEFDNIYSVAGELCMHCHAGNAIPQAACFDMTNKAAMHNRMCFYATTSPGGELTPATYEETLLYKSTRDDQNLRIACMTTEHLYHQTFMEEGMDDAVRAWYAKIFMPPAP